MSAAVLPAILFTAALESMEQAGLSNDQILHVLRLAVAQYELRVQPKDAALERFEEPRR